MLKKIRQRLALNKLSPFFDADFYLRSNPDVADAGVNPLDHYVTCGWKEGRNPSAEFDTSFYLKQYPDVAESGMNPLVHYVLHGRFENRVKRFADTHVVSTPSPSPDVLDRRTQRELIAQHFNVAHYLATYPDVAQSTLDPVDHYLDHGWKEGRNPDPDFRTAFYLEEFPDVRSSGIHPYFHYLKWGRHEGRPPSSQILDLISLKPVEQPWVKSGHLQHKCELSVVIPTYNRAHMLPALLQSWRATHKRTLYSYEIIFSDDGSDDETLDILEAATDLPITIVRNNHGGAAMARNAAVRAASGRLVLFLGDDIFPDQWLINRHVEKHRDLPVTDAVLGLCDWHPELSVNHLMRHITEIGCEQFSYMYLPRHGYTDFRHFYTCNISIDREFLLSEDIIFDEAFYKVNFEDVELGYRLAKKGMRIFYYPEAYGDHYHPYNDVHRFCVRQSIAGEMVIVFRSLHAEISHVVPLRAIEDRWSKYIGAEGVFDFYGAITALCQEAENHNQQLDAAAKANLSTAYSMLFRFAFEDGYCRHDLTGWTADVANRVLLDEFLTPDCRMALTQLAEFLNYEPFSAMRTALENVSPFRPSEQPRTRDSKPATNGCAPAVGTAAPQRAISVPNVEESKLLTVVAEDWAHLNELMELYSTQKDSLAFGIRSQIAFGGMVYEPARGTEISATVLGQILLFLETNSKVGTVVLSHGLYDLPQIGRRGEQADIIARRKDAGSGKVIRVFGDAETGAADLQSIFPQPLRNLDADGYFEFQQAGKA